MSSWLPWPHATPHDLPGGVAGCGSLSKWPHYIHGLWMGVILPTYKSWDDPPRRVESWWVFSPKLRHKMAWEASLRFRWVNESQKKTYKPPHGSRLVVEDPTIYPASLRFRARHLFLLDGEYVQYQIPEMCNSKPRGSSKSLPAMKRVLIPPAL